MSTLEMVAAVGHDGTVFGAAMKTPDGYRYVSWVEGKRSSRKTFPTPIECLPKGLRHEITDMMVLNVETKMVPFKEWREQNAAH